MVESNVKVRAHSPGRYPILVVELASGELRTLYYESGYDLESSKPVEESWLKENAIGRHSFIEVPRSPEMSVSTLRDYVRRELLEGS